MGPTRKDDRQIGPTEFDPGREPGRRLRPAPARPGRSRGRWSSCSTAPWSSIARRALGQAAGRTWRCTARERAPGSEGAFVAVLGAVTSTDATGRVPSASTPIHGDRRLESGPSDPGCLVRGSPVDDPASCADSTGLTRIRRTSSETVFGGEPTYDRFHAWLQTEATHSGSHLEAPRRQPGMRSCRRFAAPLTRGRSTT